MNRRKRAVRDLAWRLAAVRQDIVPKKRSKRKPKKRRSRHR